MLYSLFSYQAWPYAAGPAGAVAPQKFQNKDVSVVDKDAGALVRQGGEQESKDTCDRRRAEKWEVRVYNLG